MKNRLKFAGFLISRFKGLILYGIGLGILFYLIIESFVVPAHEINYFFNIALSVVALVLMAVGLFIRRINKKV